MAGLGRLISPWDTSVWHVIRRPCSKAGGTGSRQGFYRVRRSSKTERLESINEFPSRNGLFREDYCVRNFSKNYTFRIFFFPSTENFTAFPAFSFFFFSKTLIWSNFSTSQFRSNSIVRSPFPFALEYDCVTGSPRRMRRTDVKFLLFLLSFSLSLSDIRPSLRRNWEKIGQRFDDRSANGTTITGEGRVDKTRPSWTRFYGNAAEIILWTLFLMVIRNEVFPRVRENKHLRESQSLKRIVLYPYERCEERLHSLLERRK